MDIETAFSTACSLISQGHVLQALDVCDTYQALAQDSVSAARLELVRSWAYQANGNTDRAFEHIVQSLQIDAGNAWAHLQHASLLNGLGQVDAYLMALRRCLTIDSEIADAQFLIGAELHRRSLYQEAWKHYQTSMALGYPVKQEHFGALAQASDYAGDAVAAQHFATLLSTLADGSPNHYQGWLESFRAFKQAHYEQAWALYDFRHQHPNIAKSHNFSLPYWRGDYASSTTLLIHGEQGLGDEIMFAGSLPRLLSKAVSAGMRVVLAVKPGLVALFSFNFPSCIVIPHNHSGGVFANWPSEVCVNAQIPLANLPQLFLRDAADFKRNAQTYLRAPPSAIDKFEHLLNVFLPSRHKSLLVGLVWTCAQGKSKELDARAIPAEQLQALAGIQGVEFVSLHNQDHAHEAAQAPDLQILDLGLWQHDFSDTAGLIHHMDLVIGIDTATAHLAGAMGKKVLQPLLKYADWRRTTPGDQCIWYKDVQYLRQSVMHSWFDVLARVRVILAQTQREKLELRKTHTNQIEP